MNDKLKDRYLSVTEKLANACKKTGRDLNEVTLVAVSKFHPVEDIEFLAKMGQKIFGENYLQEAEEKQQILTNRGMDVEWHFIGSLQSRKARRAAGRFALIHTLDSAKLARELQKALCGQNESQRVLIEVNIAEERQKGGISANALPELANLVLTECPNLCLGGLMCMPPFTETGERARKYFSRLRELNVRLKTFTGLPLPDLSMGMSSDYQIAIEEGATIVRVGTAIFGPRPAKGEI